MYLSDVNICLYECIWRRLRFPLDPVEGSLSIKQWKDSIIIVGNSDVQAWPEAQNPNYDLSYIVWLNQF
jgi:hypothetical protein